MIDSNWPKDMCYKEYGFKKKWNCYEDISDNIHANLRFFCYRNNSQKNVLDWWFIMINFICELFRFGKRRKLEVWWSSKLRNFKKCKLQEIYFFFRLNFRNLIIVYWTLLGWTLFILFFHTYIHICIVIPKLLMQIAKKCLH